MTPQYKPARFTGTAPVSHRCKTLQRVDVRHRAACFNLFELCYIFSEFLNYGYRRYFNLGTVWVWQLYHADAEECIYELAEFTGETSALPVTGIRFILGDAKQQHLLIASCTYL